MTLHGVGAIIDLAGRGRGDELTMAVRAVHVLTPLSEKQHRVLHLPCVLTAKTGSCRLV